MSDQNYHLIPDNLISTDGTKGTSATTNQWQYAVGTSWHCIDWGTAYTPQGEVIEEVYEYGPDGLLLKKTVIRRGPSPYVPYYPYHPYSPYWNPNQIWC